MAASGSAASRPPVADTAASPLAERSRLRPPGNPAGAISGKWMALFPGPSRSLTDGPRCARCASTVAPETLSMILLRQALQPNVLLQQLFPEGLLYAADRARCWERSQNTFPEHVLCARARGSQEAVRNVQCLSPRNAHALLAYSYTGKISLTEITAEAWTQRKRSVKEQEPVCLGERRRVFYKEGVHTFLDPAGDPVPPPSSWEAKKSGHSGRTGARGCRLLGRGGAVSAAQERAF